MSGRRVLYAIHRSWPCLGGAERYMWELAKGQVSLGNHPVIYTTDARDPDYLIDPRKRRLDLKEEAREGVRLRRFRLAHPPPALRRQVMTWGRLFAGRRYRLCFGYTSVLLPGYALSMAWGREPFHLVHAGVFPHLFLIAPAVSFAVRRKIPVVVSPMLHAGEPNSANGGDQNFVSRNNMDLLRECSAVTANTWLERDELVKHGLRKDRVRVISPGVAPEEVLGGSAERFRERYGLSGQIVLHVGTQTHEKGSHHVVEAMKHLWERGSDSVLVMMGQILPDFDQYLFAQPPWVFERVVVLDHVPDREKRDALAACSLLTLPSRADSFGIVFLEAWLYGKPVVGCMAGGIPGLVEDGRDGLLVPFGDIHMLAEVIAEILKTPPLGKALGEAGRRKTLAEYGWSQAREKTESLYREVLGQ